MPDIRYVVFSDTHLGAENSVLTNLKNEGIETDNTKASPLLEKMVACLRDVISKNSGSRKPTLVLNGDIIELALTTTNNAAMAFERFIELIMPAGSEFLFDKKVLYLAGNHDHTLWERARLHDYQKYLNTLKAGEFIEEGIHATALFEPREIEATFLNALVHRYPHLQDVFVQAVYPAHAVLNDAKDRCVIFCHGHYVESMYSLMSSLRTHVFPDRSLPQTLAELEGENFAWIDFFWSELGRSGAVGRDLNLIYDKLQDPEQVKIMIRNIAESYTATQKNKLYHWVEEKMLQELLTLTLGRMAGSERNEPQVVLTPDATEGLRVYLEHYIMNAIKDELNGHVPDNVSFIFGHTHKPFQQQIRYEGFKNPVQVYNGGGWVVDTMKQQPLHGGSIILVDEHLDVAALQMYREGKENVTIEGIPEAVALDQPFYDELKQAINMNEEPWSGFASIAQNEVSIRYKNLAEIAKSGN